MGSQRNEETVKEIAVAETQIKITADTRQAERALGNLEDSLKDIEQVSSLAAKALATITAAAGAMSYAIISSIQQVGDLADAAALLGMTAQDLDAFQQSAQLAGIGADELSSSLGRMRANIGEALISGTGAANDALDRLGINLNTISRLPADKQLTTISTALKDIPNPAERSALAIDLLGKQGPKILKAAENLEKMKQQAKELGYALSDVDVKNIEAAGDSLDELSFIFKGGLKQAAAAFAPYIVAIVDNIKDSIKEAGGLQNVIRDKIVPAIVLATKASIILGAVWASGVIIANLVAITSALVRIYQGIKVATTAMEFFNAVAGKNPLVKIAGLVVGLVGAFAAVKTVDKVFDGLDKQADEILKKSQAEVDVAKAGKQDQVDIQDTLNKKQEDALKTLKNSIVTLERSVQFERDKIALGEAAANASKMISEEERKLAETKQKMSETDKQRIRDAYAALEAMKQEVALTKVLEGLETERLGVAIADKNEREVVLAIRKQEVEFGRALSEIEKDKLTTAIKQTQEAREQGAIAEAIYDATRKQTDLEKIQRGLGLQKTIGGGVNAGFVTSEKEYQKDQEALQALLDRKILSEQQYYQQREELARQYNLKIQEIELQRIERVLAAEASGVAKALSTKDQEILQKQGKSEREKAIAQDRIEFEKKSDLDKTQFALTNMQSVFSALGAQNKKAFEASKALAIASALVNTYQGATKALATYPFPFGLIAAAAAVAAGMAQVAAIRSQQYSGRALGGPVMGGQSYIVGESGPELFTPSTTGSITRNNQLGGGGDVNVNFTIVANDTEGFDQLLTSRQGVIKQIISDAMLERGQRSIV